MRRPGRKSGSGRRDRKVASRDLRKRFLIVCEGEQTEPNYFQSFRLKSTVKIRIEGLGQQPLNLVESAKRFKKQDGPFDEIWIVFDKDDVLADRFHAAIHSAEKMGFRVAWSNQAFELWYLLHFQYFDTALHRHKYIKMLKQHLREYKKNDPNIYSKLPKDGQLKAIQRAKRLVKFHGPDTQPARSDPATRVHELVESLNQHLW